MEKIIKSREILESIKAELAKLEQKIAEFAPYNLSESFIPVDLCTSTAMTLQKLAAYEESLFEKLAEYSDAAVVGLADAEKILKDAEAEAERKLLVRKFSGIKTSNPKYDELIEQLRTAAVAEDLHSTERAIADMLVADLLNNTTETAKNELVENSNYYKLAFAFNRNELFYVPVENDPDENLKIPDVLEPPKPQGQENTNSENSAGDTVSENSGNGESSDNSDSSESSESSDNSSEQPEVTESPPEPYSAENHKNEIFLDIDLTRDEDFSDEDNEDFTVLQEESSEEIIPQENDTPQDTDTISLEKDNDTADDEFSEEDEDIFFEEDEDIEDDIVEEELSDEVEEEDIAEDISEEKTSEPEIEPVSESETENEPTVSEPENETVPEIVIDEEVRPIVEEYQNDFEENPNEIALTVSESPEVNTKHNVTEIINILSPKGRNARYPVKVFQVLMSELLLYGPKTEDDLYELPDFLKNRISNSIVDGYLEKLYNKGLISRINYDGNVLYYFTKKGLKFNNHDRMISNFYCCSDKRMRSNVTKRDCRKVYPITNISVCSSVILSKIVKKYPYYLSIGSSDISVEGLSISVISKPNVRNFALSYVSDDAANLEKLYENLNRSFKALNVFDKLDTLIIGSFTLKQSQAVCKIVEKSWGEKLVSTRIVLYSYIENKYYEPNTLEEFTDFEIVDEPETLSEEDENLSIEAGIEI